MAAIIGAGAGLVSSAIGLIGAGKARREQAAALDAQLKIDPTYKTSPYAASNLGLAQTLLNSRMNGAAERARGIYGTQANTIGSVTRNATDASQALAAAAGTQGQADSQFSDLGVQENNDYLNKVQNLNQANNWMTDEYHNQFDDSVRRWQDQVNAIMTKSQAKKEGAQSLVNFGGALMNTGVAFNKPKKV